LPPADGILLEENFSDLYEFPRCRERVREVYGREKKGREERKGEEGGEEIEKRETEDAALKIRAQR